MFDAGLRTTEQERHGNQDENHIIVIVAVVLGLPILANLGGGQKAEQPASPDAAKTPVAGKTETPRPATPQQAPPGSTGTPPLNVANTAWAVSHPEYGNVTVQFFANGTLQAQSDKLPTQIQGTWQQKGNSLSISTPMGGMSAQVNGDQLTVQGQAARRLR
jgi:hypothetical protein